MQSQASGKAARRGKKLKHSSPHKLRPLRSAPFAPNLILVSGEYPTPPTGNVRLIFFTGSWRMVLCWEKGEKKRLNCFRWFRSSVEKEAHADI